MKKIQILVLATIVISVLTGIYGIVHDEITYTISHEYFTKFKFYQFGLVDLGKEAILPNPRLAVAFVGFLATYWAGILVGFGTGLIAMLQKDNKGMVQSIKTSTLIVTTTTIIAGVTGFIYGKFHLSKIGVNWWLPDNLIDKNAFITVGSIHNFSYLGGTVGLVLAIAYQITVAVKQKRLGIIPNLSN